MYDVPEWLYEYLLKFKKAEIVDIMIEALDIMHQYNGRNITFCVVSAIKGAECIENEDGAYTYKLPKKGK